MRSVAGTSRFVQRSRHDSFVAATLTVVAILVVTTSGARAGYDVSGTSSGVAVSSNLSVLSVVTANVSLNALSGTAPNAYNSNISTPSATISSGTFLTGTLLTGSTGLLTTNVSSTVDGIGSAESTNGATTVNNLNVNVLSTLVQIQATTLTSSSTVSGGYGALAASDSTGFSGLGIKVLGVDITSYIEASAGAEVDVSTLGIPALSALANLKIGLDVSTTTGNGTTSATVKTDNIIVDLTGVTYSLLALGGTLEIGQSQASMTSAFGTVPEPSSIAMTGLGIGLIGVFGARRGLRNRRIHLS